MKVAAKLLSRLPRSVTRLTQAASVLAIMGLSSFAVGLFFPKPLPVIFSMSIGHLLGALAVLTYFLAVALDAAGGPLSRTHVSAPVGRAMFPASSDVLTDRSQSALQRGRTDETDPRAENKKNDS